MSLGHAAVTKVVHTLLADTAKAIAAEAYECLAHDNDFYAEWPTQVSYVAANWTMHLPEVRAQFVKILAGEYPQAMKDPIYEAMCIDGSMRPDNRHERRVRTKTHVLN